MELLLLPSFIGFTLLSFLVSYRRVRVNTRVEGGGGGGGGGARGGGGGGLKQVTI